MRSLATALLVIGCAPEGSPPASTTVSLENPPPAPPASWQRVIGEYADGRDTLSLLEEDGVLRLLAWHGEARVLEAASDSTFSVEGGGTALLRSGVGGSVSALVREGREHARLSLGAEGGGTFRIAP
ncbi:MAG TPA: hypothetical protein VK849_08285, partial [Longimicrobiales bacterium]|nr:hypothetical protein [Longimicrobiales bacterium]